MHLIFASDLHGRIALYDALERLAASHRAQAILLGGDLLPRGVTPEDTLDMQKQFVADFLIPWMRGVSGGATPILAVPGNDDLAAAFSGAEIAGLRRLNLEGVLLDDRIRILGYPYLPPTPFPSKDHEKMDRRSDGIRTPRGRPFITENGKIEWVEVAALFARRSSIEEDLLSAPNPNEMRTVFVSHAPPYGTPLDRLHDGTPAGSTAIREWIRDRRPALSLHGHIHESPEVTGRFWHRIGNTIAVNPGQTIRNLSAVRITLTESSVRLEHTHYPPEEITLPLGEHRK